MTTMQYNIPDQSNLTLTVFTEMAEEHARCVFCSRRTKFRIYVSTDIGNMPETPACPQCITELNS